MSSLESVCTAHLNLTLTFTPLRCMHAIYAIIGNELGLSSPCHIERLVEATLNGRFGGPLRVGRTSHTPIGSFRCSNAGLWKCLGAAECFVFTYAESVPSLGDVTVKTYLNHCS